MHATAQLNAALTGRYTIDHLIGEGGMATVYLARDLRHRRQVALKVLKPDIGAVLGVDRFLSEIQVTANLQHPNLLPLFDSGEADGLLFYVMPFVEGESLRARLAREKQLPVDEALHIATAIAGALDYAHRHGVIHRDLKPENILLHEGQPLVADFGIALAVSNAGGNRITQTGLSLGTPQYMSPEQATGDRTIDARSDIYSLGAVTYEMLTGDPPHVGSSSQAIIARVLTEKPRAIRASRPSVPEYVEATVDRALEKLPADRFATAHDFAAALEGNVPVGATRRVKAARSARPHAGWRARLLDPFVLAPTLLCLVLGGLLVLRGRANSVRPETRAIRFTFEPPDKGTFPTGLAWPAAISPDGENIVITARDSARTPRLYLRRVDELRPRPIPGTENGEEPTFSPDGEWLEFEVGDKYKKVRLDGSAPVAIASGAAQNGSTWTTRDELIMGAQEKPHGLSRVSAGGGEPAPLTHPDSAKSEREHLWPVAHDDGRTIAFVIWYGDLGSSRLALTSVDDGKVRPLGILGIRALAFIGDELVYVQADGSVMAVAIDRSRFTSIGNPFPVHDPVLVSQSNGNSQIFVSRTGGLVTLDVGTGSRLAWLGGNRGPQPVLRDERRFWTPRLSPDGTRVVALIRDGSASDSWIVDLKSSTLTRLSTLESVTDNEWSADGRNVLLTTRGGDIYLKALDASPPHLVARLGRIVHSGTISPDGRAVVLQALVTPNWNLLIAGPDSSTQAKPYFTTPGDEYSPRFSPDGKWVVMESDDAGPQREVFIRSFPDPSRTIQISAGGGTAPVWSSDGKSITYANGDALVRARTSGPPDFQVLGRDTVLTGATQFNGEFDVAPDGRVLAAIRSQSTAQAVVVPNWLVEFRQRERANRRR